MQKIAIDVGMVVRSRAGRDEGRQFLVVGILDKDYALLADGSLRRVEAPKKKKLRHIQPTKMVVSEAIRCIGEGTMPTNAEIRRWLSNEEEQ